MYCKPAQTKYVAKHYSSYTNDTRYAGVSWGLFDEAIKTQPLERYGRTVYNTKSKTITGFVKDDVLYNQYNFDPVMFAWPASAKQTLTLSFPDGSEHLIV